MENRRITTAKTKIRPIVRGKFVKCEGFTPSYVLTQLGQKLSRVRLVATVLRKYVAESGNFAALTLDDGTETIGVKVFNAVSMFENLKEGDDIDIIGKVREYQGEVYLFPEIIHKIDDPNIELLREVEIKNQKKELEKSPCGDFNSFIA